MGDIEGRPRLGPWCEVSADSCLRGAHCRNLWVPREQPSSITTKTPAALLLHLTHRNTGQHDGGRALATMNTLTHTGGTPPLPLAPLLHSQPHHGDTTATQYCHGYQGTCVCSCARLLEKMWEEAGCHCDHAEETLAFLVLLS